MLDYCQLHPKGHVSMELILFEIKKFPFRKMHLKVLSRPQSVQPCLNPAYLLKCFQYFVSCYVTMIRISNYIRRILLACSYHLQTELDVIY